MMMNAAGALETSNPSSKAPNNCPHLAFPATGSFARTEPITHPASPAAMLSFYCTIGRSALWSGWVPWQDTAMARTLLSTIRSDWTAVLASPSTRASSSLARLAARALSPARRHFGSRISCCHYRTGSDRLTTAFQCNSVEYGSLSNQRLPSSTRGHTTGRNGR